MRPLSFVSIDKWFTYKSTPFIWEIRSAFTERNYSLFKYVGNRKFQVGAFQQQGNKVNGTLSLETKEISDLVGLATFLAILRGK